MIPEERRQEVAGHQQEADEVLESKVDVILRLGPTVARKDGTLWIPSCARVCSIQRRPLWSVVVRVPKLVKLLTEGFNWRSLVSSKQSCVICSLHCLPACEKPWGCGVRKGLASFTVVTCRI